MVVGNLTSRRMQPYSGLVIMPAAFQSYSIRNIQSSICHDPVGIEPEFRDRNHELNESHEMKIHDSHEQAPGQGGA
jgi:hypothetical protein